MFKKGNITKKILFACQKRPLALWIILFCWYTFATALCTILLYTTLSPLSLCSYVFLGVPLLHLFIYVKPLIIYEVIQIVFTNLAFVNIVCSYIWLETPRWIFGILLIAYLLIAALAFCLEIRMFNKKYRNGSLDAYLQKIGGRTYIKRK